MIEPGGADSPPQSGISALGTRLRTLLRHVGERVRGTRSGEGVLEALTVLALLGGGLLILAEFLNLYEIEIQGLVVKQQAGGSSHSYAMLVVGAATIGATLLARSTEQWLPALGIVVLGGCALALVLIVDLPDATRTDLVRGAQLAEAHPAIGFWTELLGAVVALASGLGLVRLLRRRMP
jgi:hypothetical protein